MDIPRANKSGLLDDHGSPYNQLVPRATSGHPDGQVASIAIEAVGNPVYLLLADALNADGENE